MSITLLRVMAITPSSRPWLHRLIWTGRFGCASTMRRATGLNASFTGAEFHPSLSAECDGTLPPTPIAACTDLQCAGCSRRRGAFNFHMSEPLPGGMYLSEGLPPLAAFARAEQCRVRLTEAEARGAWSRLSVSDILPAHLSNLVQRVAANTVARSFGWCGGTGSKANEPGEIPVCFPWRAGSKHEVTCKHGQAEPSGIGWGPFRQMMAPGCIVHASHAVCRLVSSAATVRRPAAVIAEPTALCAQGWTGWTKSEVIFLRSPSLRQRMELMLLALGSGPC